MCQEKNWHQLFTGKLEEQGIDAQDIATIYRIEMELRAFFDFGGLMPPSLRLQNICRGNGVVEYYWKSESSEAKCPHCGTISTNDSGGVYDRRIQDVPQMGDTVYHIISSKRYGCANEACTNGLFTERFYDLTDEQAHKTHRFKEHCIERSLGCGCNRAEREIRAEGGIVSNDSIARYLKAKASDAIEKNITSDSVKVLSIDDFNGRKGDKSTGFTVFIDQETRKVLIIVCGTNKDAANRVMELFPSADFLSRDRATAYASAGAEHNKIQVADRFHLFKNAHEVIKNALNANIPATILIREGDGWRQEGDAGNPDKASYYTVPEHVVDDRVKLAGLTKAKELKYRETLKLIELSGKGIRTDEIAKMMGISTKRVEALRRSVVDTIKGVEEKINSKLESGKAGKDFDTEQAQDRPGLSIESVARGSIYRAILKEASSSRESTNSDIADSDIADNGESSGETMCADVGSNEFQKANKTVTGKTSRPATSANSPYSEQILDLMYGPEIAENTEDKGEEGNKKGKKKPSLMN